MMRWWCRPSWPGLRAARLLVHSQHPKNVPGSLYRCQDPVFIYSTPTDWPVNRLLLGLISRRRKILRQPEEMILNAWWPNMNTYGGTISPSHLAGICCANGDNQGCGDAQ